MGRGKGSVDIILVWVMMLTSPSIQSCDNQQIRMLAGSVRLARLVQLTTVTTDAYDVATIIGLSNVERMLVRTFPPML
jgi:hypothetical protein